MIDQLDRDRFVQEHAKNISVIAPAGVGKTTSIVGRIVHLARLPEAQAIERLPRLVVVTYSVRAAQQMQQKARVAIREAGVSTRVQRAFLQTFFGTIHSYCVRLLERFGHYLGLPSPVGLLQDDTELWHRFLLRGLGQGMDANLRDLFHFYPPEKLYALGKDISPGDAIAVTAFPTLDLQRVLDYRDNALHAATKKTITTAQEAARIWREGWARGDRFRPLPKCPGSDKAAGFAEIWNAAFSPLHDWLRHSALAFGRHIANAYEAFRLEEAVMTYDDQVRLALRVLNDPAVRRELASEKLSVLLDEAQDTDRRQFEVLQKVAGLGSPSSQADDQSFCIVGDFQQAIYAPRSDLGMYRRVHDEISAEPRGTSSRLRVTFRCDTAIIDLANRIFPSVLNAADGQCAFVPLVARDDAGPGQALRWLCPDEPDHAAGKKITADIRARHEARFIAQRIHQLGPAGLGAGDWSEVAILCPRKNWLLEIQRELVALDLPVQLHSSSEQQRDRTPAAWLTALIWVAAHPEDSFEIAGVLREILGVSDSDMAHFTHGNGEKLRLDQPNSIGHLHENRPSRNKSSEVAAAVPSGGAPEAPSTSPLFASPTAPPLETAAAANFGHVEHALRILRNACAQINTLPLHEAIHQLVTKTELRERLNSIEDLALENIDRELDDFLAVIAARSAEGATLASLAEELRLGLTQVHPAEEEIRNAIQLLTSHKAKGLEWQTVIVPYVFRTIESKSLPYPRVVSGAEGREIVCRDKSDFLREASDFVTTRDRQQLQRLLYVMVTRAKRTLVLIDDETLYSGQIRRSGWSAGELLGLFGGENRATWSALPESNPAFEIPTPRKTARVGPAWEFPSLPSLSRRDIDRALTRADRFPRRTTPHALAIHSRDESEPETRTEQEEDFSTPATDNPGILYGIWWHEFVQTIPWQKPISTWQKVFAEAQLRSPQPRRSAHEWELFLQSKLASWLNQPGRIIQVELPFLWPEAPQSCLEGVMDLAVYSETDATWNIIDWKTNRPGPLGSPGLVETYRSQIEAYMRSLTNLTNLTYAQVTGSLYLTHTGEWLPVA